MEDKQPHALGQEGIAAQAAWHAAGYVRLSREDQASLGQGAPSNSIQNQQRIIRRAVRECPDVQVTCWFQDDGFSGSTFVRPGFRRMMELVESGQVNCVICKDLSRLGRNYLEVGNLIERVLPALGVRLIALGDGYDSLAARRSDDALLVPFTNLVNDSYCATASMKVRAALQARRERGLLVSAHAVFGYRVAGEGPRHLEPHPKAAQVVVEIFRLRIAGLSVRGIARVLNQACIAPPLAWRDSAARCGRWQPRTVARVLGNQAYTGKLLQGRTRKVSFRSAQVMRLPREEWVEAPQAHEALIAAWQYQVVASLAARPFRCAPGQVKARLLSGLLLCADCGHAMVRGVTRAKGVEYGYYRCSAHRHDARACSSHAVRDVLLQAAVCQAVLQLLELDPLQLARELQQSRARLVEQVKAGRRDALQEAQRCQDMIARVEADSQAGILSLQEAQGFLQWYGARRQQCLALAAQLRRQVEAAQGQQVNWWLLRWAHWRGSATAQRAMLVELVEYVEVGADRTAQVVFRCAGLLRRKITVGKRCSAQQAKRVALAWDAEAEVVA